MQTNDWKFLYENQNSKQTEGSSQEYWHMFYVLIFRTASSLAKGDDTLLFSLKEKRSVSSPLASEDVRTEEHQNLAEVW